MKICTVCGEQKSYDDFYKNSKMASGYTTQCKTCVGKCVKEYRLKNIDKFKQIRKDRYWVDRGNNIKLSVEWGKENKDKRKIIKDRWRSKNKELTNYYTRLRIFQRKKAGGKHTFKEWEDLKKLSAYACLCCGKTEPKIKLSIDHIIPICKGGTSDIENIQPLCISCNSKKSSKIIKYKL